MDKGKILKIIAALFFIFIAALSYYLSYYQGLQKKYGKENLESLKNKETGQKYPEAGESKNNSSSTPDQNGFELSSGWTVTSYEDVNEAVYDNPKIEVFDSEGNSLGFYKSDFLEQVQIDGSGKGDSNKNPGKFLHYNYDINDGKTYYLADKSLGAYNNEIVPWTGDKPSVAVNPPLSLGTMIRFKDLGPSGSENPDWVVSLLKSKTFYADDKFFGMGDEKRIDVYVGLQKTKNTEGTPESLLMNNVTIYIKKPQ